MAREESENLILKAVEDIILEGNKLGINAIAKKSGLNKVLIYRYFNGLDGLLTTFAKKINLWEELYHDVNDIINKGDLKPKEIFIWAMREYRIRLMSSPLYLNLLKLEIGGPSPLTKKLETEREEAGGRIISLIVRNFPEYDPVDLAYISSFVLSGITYLVIRSTQINIFAGLDLNSQDTWERFDSIWEKLVP